MDIDLEKLVRDTFPEKKEYEIISILGLCRKVIEVRDNQWIKGLDKIKDTINECNDEILKKLRGD